MRTQSLPRALPVRNRKQRHRFPLQSKFILDLNKVKLRNPYLKMPPYKMLFYQNPQPPTLCPATAGVLDSLHECTRSGLLLMDMLLREQIISYADKKYTSIFLNWTAASLAVPILGISSARSNTLTRHSLSEIRRSANRFQTDLHRILSSPPETQLTQLPHLLLDYNNLKLWLQHSGILRLAQLRRLIDKLLPLDDELLSRLDVDTANATYVVEWVISRHNALFTSAHIVRPGPLDISPSFVPTTLIKELTEGTYPQVPWHYSWRLRNTPPPPLLTPIQRQPLALSPPPTYHPMSPVYQPLLTPRPSCPSTMSPPTLLTPLPLQSLPLPSGPPLNQSSLLLASHTHQNESWESSNSFNRLPPIVPLEEALPITARLISVLNSTGSEHQHLMAEIMRITTAMSLTTT